MIRISTIFVAICMVLVAASLGLVLYSVAGISGPESAIVALAALTFLILYNAVSMRLRDRTDIGGQIADLSRGTADLARQVAEFGRRLAVIEGRVISANSTGADRMQTVVNEIGELGGLVKQLATSVANHEDLLATLQANAAVPAGASAPPQKAEVSAPTIAPQAEEKRIMAAALMPDSAEQAPARSHAQILGTIRSAIDENCIDIYLQPMVTLPQRKVRFYEAMTRLRDDKEQVVAAEEFVAIAEASGLIGRIDHMVLLRCVQVLRRLMVRNKEVGVFCNVSSATLANPSTFSQCLDFLEANRALAPALVIEFKQATFRSLGPTETEHLAALAQRGFRFSIDHVTDLRIDPRDLADRGVRFIKVPAALLLDPKQTSSSDIHPSDLSDLLGRFGIDLIAERIEGERAVVDLLDYDVRFGQGFLFAPPRPLRPEGAGNGAPSAAAETTGSVRSAVPEPPAVETQPRASGNAALARRVAGPA
jgi:cyclic-di-GMP phosphodiesterase, flagellum assembly factor TipF